MPQKSKYLIATTGLIAVLSLSCSTVGTPQTQPKLDTDVIGIEEKHLDSAHWINKTRNHQKVLLSPDDIQQMNQRLFESAADMVNLDSYPTQLTRDELIRQVRQISSIPSSPRYYPDGQLVTPEDFEDYELLLNLDNIEARSPVKYGMAVKRTNMRTYPTTDRVYKKTTPTDLDRFQENALFPADAVAVLHDSADGNWLLVQSYNYLAWVPAQDIAIGSWQEIREFTNAAQFIVVTGDSVTTNFNPAQTNTSEIHLEMGVKLPLSSAKDVSHNLHGQNPYTSYLVQLPTRAEDGKLVFEFALIARGKDLRKGHLPYTRRNLIQQSFKFLGERYGWGHSYNARDCTGFVSEVYKTFGIYLPRNSGDQARSSLGENLRFEKNSSPDTRQQALTTLEVGNLIYIPGHVMMYLGHVDGEPYVIHDVAGLNYKLPSGDTYSGVLSGVSITPLTPLRLDEQRTYVSTMTSIKRIK